MKWSKRFEKKMMVRLYKTHRKQAHNFHEYKHNTIIDKHCILFFRISSLI